MFGPSLTADFHPLLREHTPLVQVLAERIVPNTRREGLEQTDNCCCNHVIADPLTDMVPFFSHVMGSKNCQGPAGHWCVFYRVPRHTGQLKGSLTY